MTKHLGWIGLIALSLLMLASEVFACPERMSDLTNEACRSTLATTLAGEDVLSDVQKTEERYLTIPIGGTTAMIAADQLYKSAPGYVRGIECYGTDAAATAGTITLLDSTTAGTGNVLWSRTILAADYSIAGIKSDLQTPFAVGLYLDFTTTTDVSCIVRYR